MNAVGAAVGPAVVRTRALRKAYGELVAVAGLDLEIGRGEVFGLLGPNGSGKTTTIRMLCGLVVPTSGTADVAGLDVETNTEGVRRRIGYMSQRYGLYDELTVAENLRFYSSVYGLVGHDREQRLADHVESLGLGPRLQQRAGTLSGGWKQRLAFLSRGHLIGLGTPAEIVKQFNANTIEDVFVMLQHRDEADEASAAAQMSAKGRS